MKTDVLIVGAGLTGTVAADEIIQNSDFEVIQLSAGKGASPFIHGFCIPVGEGDNEELFYLDSMNSGYWQSDPKLVHQLCKSSKMMLDFFEELDLQLDQNENGVNLLHSLGSSVPRIAGIQNNTGPVMLKKLQERLRKSEHYKNLTGQRAVELICKDDRVIGAKCYDLERETFYSIYAKVVILATGGFGRLFPESTNSKDIGGDGLAMAYVAGATLTDMEFIQFEPSAAVWPPQVSGKGIITTMFYEGAVLRGVNGSRFMLDYSEAGERVSKDVQAKCIYSEMQKNGKTPHGGVWFDATSVPDEMWQGVYQPYLKRYLACGIDLRKEPVEIAPAAHTTCGGVKIDENCRTGIDGFIACGEVTGGLHGANRLGGNAGLETMVFGKIAGKSAIEMAEQALESLDNEKEDIVPNQISDIDLCTMREDLQNILRDCLNVLRNKEGLEKGLIKISEIITALCDYQNCYEKYRLYNDALTSYMAVSSALERNMSIGCHCREDGIEDNKRYRVEIKKIKGHMSVQRRLI